MLAASSSLVLGLAVSVTLGAPARPPEEPEGGWSRVRSPHFEVLTDAGPPLAGHAAERLERLRGALLRLFPPRVEGERQIFVLLLASRSRFESLVPRRHRRPAEVEGFFQGGGESDTIVARLSTGRRGPYAAVEHEYAHLVLNRSLPAQPVWVAEGLAELLSDGVLDPPEVLLGASVPEHAARVREAPVALAGLLGVRHDSPEYLGAADGSLLYSRSWALARWAVARPGLARLRAFLDAVAEGGDPLVAFAENLAPPEEAQATLLDVPPGPLLRVRIEEADLAAVRVDTPSRADVQCRLGDLLLQGGETGRAREHLDRALAADPGHVGARTALAALHARRGEWAEARGQLGRVLALSPGDPGALLGDARLRVAEARATGESLAPELEARLVSQLEDALSRAPDLYEAALLLAELRPDPPGRRIAALLPAFEQDPGRTDVARALAALHVKRRDLAAARRVLQRARDAARDPGHRFLCEHLLARLSDYAEATAEVRGRLLHLECRADGSLRFTVEAAAGILRLEAPSARSFLVYGEGEASGERELVCGPQSRPVAVRYQPSGTGTRGVQGSVLWLAFSGGGG